jgi:hypothetical protein
MKRIEAVIPLAALDDFHRCARKLGIFGFDLSVPKSRLCDHQRRFNQAESKPVSASRIKVDFAVLDEQTNPTIHAVLESVHPESIGVFKFDEDTRPVATLRRWPKLPSIDKTENSSFHFELLENLRLASGIRQA